MVRSAVALAGVTVALFGAAAGVRFGHLEDLANQRRASMVISDDLLRSPGPDTLQIASMEYAPAFADLLWLQIVQELSNPMDAGHAGWDRVQRWANIAVDLDRHYFTVYDAAAIHLIVYGKKIEAARAILLKGRKNLPMAWEMPFLLGYLEYFLEGNPEAAAEWWRVATTLPDVPRFVPSLAARAKFQGGDEAGAIALLETMIESLDGPHKVDAQIRLRLLKSELRLRLYDEACKKFLAAEGRRPKNGAELHDRGYVAEPPFDYLDDPIEIDEACRGKTKEVSVREDVAKKRIGSQLNDVPSETIE